MGMFYETLAGLPEALAQARMQTLPDPNQDTLSAQMATSQQPMGYGADPVMGGLFSMVPQLMAQQQGSIRSGPDNLMTRRGVTGVAPALRTLLDAKRATGLPVLANVVSDYRTRAEQQRLYDAYLAGTGNLAAPPGSSMHEEGRAFDISTSFLSEHPDLVRYLLANGFDRDVPGEPWHFSWDG